MIAAPTSITWPPERFYWALLDAPGLKCRGGRAFPLPPGLLAELADHVPQPIEEMWVVGTHAGNGQMLVCAARRGELAEVEVTARSLTPTALPPGVDGGLAALLPALNLLVGEFEPAPLRRERWRWHRARALVVVVLVGLVVTGMARRTSHWSKVAHTAEQARAKLAADLLGPLSHPAEANLALDAEIDRLRAAARNRPTLPRDASVQLVSLLNAWPATVPSKPQSVAVNDSGVSVSVSVDGDAAPFLSAFKAPNGWSLDEPRLNKAGEVTRMTLRLRPTLRRATSETGANP
ncbi:MAG: hypothetical protein IT436_13520 [Phycisphaerales bacterium]|nr:hypothetical protein [Phycisphaerales bacterium]